MALARAPCAVARPRLHSSRAAHHATRPVVADARRSPVSTAAAAPRAGGDSRSNDARSSAVSASASLATEFVSCPWPRPPSYQEPATTSEKRRSFGSRMALVVAKIMNGDTGALPPAVARLGGAFTDGCAVDGGLGLEDGNSSASPSSSQQAGENPLLRAAARLWRYQGMR